MRDWKQFVRERLRLAGISGAREAEIVEELSQQLEECCAEAMAGGASEPEAMARAEAQFPEWAVLRRNIREAVRPVAGRAPEKWVAGREQREWSKAGGWSVLYDIWMDVRFGLRMLRKSPVFTIVAVLTLALAIGSNTAIFSVVNAVLLRSLPLPEAEQLVTAFGKSPTEARTWISYPDFEDYRAQSKSFAALSAVVGQSVNLTGRDEPTRVIGVFVSSSFFDVLGVKPAMGRGFLPGEDKPGAEAVAVVSYNAWQGTFGADPQLIGKPITLNNKPFTVVGIMPQGFVFPVFGEADVWMAFQHWPNFVVDRKRQITWPMGRLKPGVTLAQAQSEITTIAAQLEQQYPDSNQGLTLRLYSLHQVLVEDLRPQILTLFGAVVFVLLIACANVGNLLLSRAAARHKEMATRAALGAGRARLVRQLLTETVLLWMAGGALALLIGDWGIRGLLAMAPANLPESTQVRLDGTVLAFTLGVSFATGLLFGLMPALRFSRPDLQETLKESSRATTCGAGRSRLRAALVVAQVSLALLLLCGAGLLLRSFLSVTGVNPGFDQKNLLTMEYRVPRNKYPELPQQWEFHRRVVEKVREIPGVESVTTVRALPFSGNSAGANFTLPDRPAPPDGAWRAGFNTTDSNFFHTMRIPVLRGRVFTEQDTATSPRVVVINQAMAQRFWPDGDPVGREIRMDALNEKFPATIIGVVGNTKHSSLETPEAPQIYSPMAQLPFIFTTLAVRTQGDPMQLAKTVRAAVWSVDRDQPVWKMRPLEMLVQRSLGPKRFLATLVGAYSGLALLLAALGIYGVMAYSVTQRAHEIGIRMALGAGRQNILRLVLQQGMLLTALGVACGIAAAAGLTRFLETLLFGVRPTDPLTFAAVVALLLLAALVACVLPALRAARVDPLVTLRYE